MKKAFIFICTNILAFLKWILGIIRDISTAIREGDKNSAISSRRCIAVTFVVAFIYSISIAIRTFVDLLQYGWIAALIFIPSVICVVAAIIFSYFASIKDFKETISTVAEAIDGIKLPHIVSEDEKIVAHGVAGDLPAGTVISGATGQS
jgi:hypothetical protein